MIPEAIRRKRDQLAEAQCHVSWCDDNDLDAENMPGVGPGGDINPFGWYVIGTTGGGNGVVVRADDPGVYFADHEWDADNNADAVRRALVPLALSIEEFLESVDEMAARLYKIG